MIVPDFVFREIWYNLEYLTKDHKWLGQDGGGEWDLYSKKPTAYGNNRGWCTPSGTNFVRIGRSKYMGSHLIELNL